MDAKLVSFECRMIETPADFGGTAPGALACATIDGYPSDPNTAGRVICRIWLTGAIEFIEDWREPEYRDAAKEMAAEARKDLLAAAGGVTATKRETALLDWIFRNAHACPFADSSGIDFESECVGFGQAGCGDCILRNIGKLGKTD